MIVLVLVPLALALWSLAQAGRLRTPRGVLSVAVATLGIGVWLVTACGVESVDVGYGFVGSDGPLPVLVMATRMQLLGGALIWVATLMIAGLVGRRLVQRRVTDEA